MTTQLAIQGGEPIRRTPFPSPGNASGHTFDDSEMRLLAEVLQSGRLNRNAGTLVRRFEDTFAEFMEVPHSCFVTSGTAAIHCAVGALDLEPGDEIITSPITDMGTVVPILQQNCIPIFADLHLDTFCLDAEDVERRITPRTRAIIPVHLAGNPTDMKPLMELAERHGLTVIEDCAQAYEAEYHGQRVGTMGALGCFSLNQGKHITCGDGGMVITRDGAMAERMTLFADKGWPRAGDVRDHLFLSPNYRVTELQAAVALAQLARLKGIVAGRRELADQLTSMLTGCPGVQPPVVTPGGVHSWWWYGIKVPAPLQQDFAAALRAEGIPANPGYIPKPVYLYPVLREKRTYGRSKFPFCPPYGRDVDYAPGMCPTAERIITELITLPINEHFTGEDIADIGNAVAKVAESMVAAEPEVR